MRVTTMTSPHTDIEDVLCSKTRLKILKVLMHSEPLTVSEIAKRTAVNYVIARAHLETLENGSILTHLMFGKRIRYYKFKDSPIAKAVKDLIEAYSERARSVERSLSPAQSPFFLDPVRSKPWTTTKILRKPK